MTLIGGTDNVNSDDSTVAICRTRSDARFSLAGKVAVVAGAGSVVDTEVALGLAAGGAVVAIATADAGRRTETADTLARTTEGNVLHVPFQIEQWGDCDRLFNTVSRHFGSIDILVTNACPSVSSKPPVVVTEDEYEDVVHRCLTGPFRLNALFGTFMVKSRGGSIVNISSVAAVSPAGRSVPYSAANAGLNALTVGFARTFGPRVRVNGIMTDPVLAERYGSDEEFDRSDQRIPSALQRIGVPSEIVGTAIYLASAASSYTTGAVIKVDGGLE